MCLNENKAKLLTVADFCSAAQVEFPIRERYACTVYRRPAAPMHPSLVLQDAQTLHIWSLLMPAEHTDALIHRDRFAVKHKHLLRNRRALGYKGQKSAGERYGGTGERDCIKSTRFPCKLECFYTVDTNTRSMIV